jgi:hypothetical protein
MQLTSWELFKFQTNTPLDQVSHVVMVYEAKCC